MLLNIKETAALVQEISTSSSEQTMSVEQINTAQSNDLEEVSNTLSEEYDKIVLNLKRFKCA